jgi:hypothetical protein
MFLPFDDRSTIAGEGMQNSAKPMLGVFKQDGLFLFPRGLYFCSLIGGTSPIQSPLTTNAKNVFLIGSQ